MGILIPKLIILEEEKYLFLVLKNDFENQNFAIFGGTVDNFLGDMKKKIDPFLKSSQSCTVRP